MISSFCFNCMAPLLQKPDLHDICRDGKKLPPEDLTYASQYWAKHLAESKLSQSLIDHLYDFASVRLLYWIESLSLIGNLDLGISGLGNAIKALVVRPHLHDCDHNAKLTFKRSGQVPDQVTELLSDAPCFLEHFEDLLSISAMNTYSAALPLTPRTTRIYQQYGSKFEGMAVHLTLKWDI